MSTSSITVETLCSSENDDTVNGMVDYTGQRAKRLESGYWRSACYIIGSGAAERFAYYGIASNLITYLIGPLGQPTATAAASINLWTGTSLLLPLVGALVADSFFGRYRTIVLSSVLYILALGLLTTSALLNRQDFSRVNSQTPTQLHITFFYVSLYLIALGQGMHKPCIMAFGADQFDYQDPIESRGRSSFFNWWTFSACSFPLTGLLALNYIQDNISWSLGFGIPCMSMLASLIVFVIGTKSYRYNAKIDEKCALFRVSHVFFKAAINYRIVPSQISDDEEDQVTSPQLNSQQFKFLNKALLSPDGCVEYEEVCSTRELEEAKSLLKLIPLWATSLAFATVIPQCSTLFTEQGITMDRSITSSFSLPAASLQYITTLTIITVIPLYDRIFVPISRHITGISSGITKLQRIGIGMILCTICMVIAALVERKRLKTAFIHGMSYLPNSTFPMSFLWLMPQYILYGVAEVFTLIGLQEVFYDEVSCDLKSIGLSFFLSICGIGNLMSSFLIWMIERVTSEGGAGGWFSDNINQSHLDYFYWLLAGANVVCFLAFLWVAKSFSS